MKASFNHWCRRQQARSDLCRSPSAYSGGGATCYGNRVRIRFGFQTVPTRILFPQLDGGRLDEPCWLICVALKVTLGCFSFSVFLLMMFYVLNCNISKSTKVRSGTNLTASAWTKKKNCVSHLFDRRLRTVLLPQHPSEPFENNTCRPTRFCH